MTDRATAIEAAMIELLDRVIRLESGHKVLFAAVNQVSKREELIRVLLDEKKARAR